MKIGYFQIDMLDPFVGYSVVWPYWLFTYNIQFFNKNTNIFTDFEVWQIENVIKLHFEVFCDISEPRRHAENRNVRTLNDYGLIYIVSSDISNLSHSTNIKTLLTKQWRKKSIFVAEHPNPFACWNLNYE